MKEKMISVKILGKLREYPYGTPYSKIVEDFPESTRYPIVLVMKDKKLCELHKKLKKDGELEFITLGDEIGHKTYKRSASLLLLKAVYHVGHGRIRKVTLHFSVGSGYYYTIDGDVEITPEFLAQVKAYMLELAERKIPIRKRSVGTSDPGAGESLYAGTGGEKDSHSEKKRGDQRSYRDLSPPSYV